MQTIKIKKISVTNFKGLRSLEVDFNEDGVTDISGPNGCGKSTIKDAFIWLLFNKDAAGRESFSIKTCDEQGEPIPHLPHEVEAILSVNGKELRLRKCINEKWTNPRDGEPERLVGNTTSYYVNDVPKKATEYKQAISDLCDEQIFKVVTSPTYFTSMHWQDMRKALFAIAGEPSDEEIINGDNGLKTLLDLLYEGKSIEELRLQINAERTRLKKELEDIPSRIDECERTKPQGFNWAEIEAEKEKINEEISRLEKMLESETSRVSNFNKERVSVITQIGEKELAIQAQKSEVKSKAVALIYRSKQDLENLKTKKSNLEYSLARDKDNKYVIERQIKEDEARAERIQNELAKMRDEWKSISQEAVTFDEAEFICPSCKRRLEEDNIEEIKSKLEANFNEDKARRLQANTNRGKSAKAEYEAIMNRIGEYKAKMKDADKSQSELAEQIGKLDEEISSFIMPSESDIVKQLYEGGAGPNLENELNQLRNKLATLQEMPSDGISELKAKISTLRDSLDVVGKKMAVKPQIERVEARIAELHRQQREVSQRLADKNKIDAWIEKYNKRKAELVTNKVNRKFSIVKWKLYKELINGGEEPTCEPLIDGVPFFDANRAGRINAGLDIINAISDYYGIYAPVFVDNAEAVNQLLATSAQMVRMIVTNGSKLEISHSF